ncbi:MAG: molybdopterin dinucleotide binding domain-containing protein, partial [Cyanobacteria bacterium P01_F01_bin.153]
RIGKMHPEAFLEIHPGDAETLGLANGDWVVVKSRRGRGRFRAKVTEAIAQGTVFAPMHWGALWATQAEVNALTHPEVCPTSKQPELKACAVHLASEAALKLSRSTSKTPRASKTSRTKKSKAPRSASKTSRTKKKKKKK